MQIQVTNHILEFKQPFFLKKNRVHLTQLSSFNLGFYLWRFPIVSLSFMLSLVLFFIKSNDNERQHQLNELNNNPGWRPLLFRQDSLTITLYFLIVQMKSERNKIYERKAKKAPTHTAIPTTIKVERKTTKNHFSLWNQFTRKWIGYGKRLHRIAHCFTV